MKKIVYLDERLKTYVVPTEMRNNSKAENKVFTPGTRIPLPEEAKFVRLFTAWATASGKQGSIDVDLGGAFIKEDAAGNLSMHPIAYYNQSANFAVHSGDWTSCRAFDPKEGSITAEYIDVDIARAKKEGFKYAITAEFIFSRAKDYGSMQAWSGVQLLTELRTAKKQAININDSLFKVKLGGEYQSHTALAIDLVTNEIVILDQYSEEQHGINVSSMASKMNTFKKLYFNAAEFSENVYDLMEMYCKANEIEVVEDIAEANIICSYDDYKGLAANQTMFNVSNELENIVNLLN
jgi:hypothetical protein